VFAAIDEHRSRLRIARLKLRGINPLKRCVCNIEQMHEEDSHA